MLIPTLFFSELLDIQQQYRHDIQRLQYAIAIDSARDISVLGPSADNPCEKTKIVLDRVLKYVQDDNDLMLALATMENFESILPSFALATRKFIKASLLVAMNKSDRDFTKPIFHQFNSDTCGPSFSSRMYMIQELVLQSAKRFWLSNKPNNFHSQNADGVLGKKKVLLFTHNLEIEGAPKCVYQLASYLKQHSVQIAIISPRTGPLKKIYESMGVPVTIRPKYQFKAGGVEELLGRWCRRVNLKSHTPLHLSPHSHF